MSLYVLLSSCGNVDYGQNPFESVQGAPQNLKKVKTLEEASIVCRDYIVEHCLGGGNWSGGFVFDSKDFKNQVAYISYNGRIWTEGEYMLKYQGELPQPESVKRYVISTDSAYVAYAQILSEEGKVRIQNVRYTKNLQEAKLFTESDYEEDKIAWETYLGVKEYEGFAFVEVEISFKVRI